LVDGAVRDADELKALGLPVWTRWVSPRGARRERLLALGRPVYLAGVEVRLGDYLVLDGDGVVVEMARERAARESSLRERFAGGEVSLDLYGLREGVAWALAEAARLREEEDAS
jgi:4-hydroxy-4-methyl-2-oxoglutarate aldolase